MGTLQRGEAIATQLEAAGIRAYVDPSIASPPCILVIPPALQMDLNCAYSATWQLVALAPAVNTADRSSWQALDTMLDAAVTTIDVQSAEPVAYVLNGRSYPAYLISLMEGV